MNRRNVIILAIVLVSFIVSACYYSQLPSRVASHWDIQGQVNGYTSRFWGAFLMPVVILGLALLFLAIPYIDPLRKNIEKFRKHFDLFVILILLFMLAIHLQTLLWNTGTQIPLNATLPIGLGLLYFYIGVLFTHAKRNWFVGIRTPWTLSSEKVWDRTHRLGSKLFKISGVLSIVGVFFPGETMWFAVVPVLVSALYTTVYSYLIYRR